MLDRRVFLNSSLVAAGGLVIPLKTSGEIQPTVIKEAQDHLVNFVTKTYNKTVQSIDVTNAQVAISNVVNHFTQINYDLAFREACHRISPTDPIFEERYMATQCWKFSQKYIPEMTFKEVNDTFLKLPIIYPSSVSLDLGNTGLRPVLLNANKVLEGFKSHILSNNLNPYPGDPGLCLIAKETLMLMGYAQGIVAAMCFLTEVLVVLCIGWAVVGLILLALKLVIAVLCGL